MYCVQCLAFNTALSLVLRTTLYTTLSLSNARRKVIRKARPAVNSPPRRARMSFLMLIPLSRRRIRVMINTQLTMKTGRHSPTCLSAAIAQPPPQEAHASRRGTWIFIYYSHLL